MQPITYAPRTPAADSAVPKKDRDPRTLLAPHAERLTALMLAPSLGEHCADRYVDNLRRDIGKFRRNPVMMALCVAYHDVQRGKSEADVGRWFDEARELVRLWCEERDAARIQPPDLIPFVQRSQRAENAADLYEIDVRGIQDDPDKLVEYERALEVEIAKDTETLDAVRERVVRLRVAQAPGNAGEARAAVPAPRPLAAAGAR